MNLEKLGTERVNPNTIDIDECKTEEILKKINDEDSKISKIVRDEIPNIAKLIDATYEAVKNGGRIIYVGAGTSGRLGVLDASECPPTYGVSEEMVQGIIAGGKDAMFVAQEGAEDSLTLPIEDLKEINVSKKDFVIGLAASGRTPYVVAALEYANEIGAGTGSVCCVTGGEISKYAKFPIEVNTGPEVVTGSTRMKAGSAQKMVLNMISTATMIKLGKVYRNYMVDLQPTNLKLEKRACSMIQKLLDVNEDKAEELFNKSGKNVKIALMMSISNCEKESAEVALNQVDGHLKEALRILGKELVK